jgi:putative DNA primase/helicase
MDRPYAKPTPLGRIKEIWDGAGTLVEGCGVRRYLAGRGITLHEIHSVRQAREGMIALVRDANGRGCQLHRTIITGGKLACRLFMPGRIPPGAAVRLQSHGDVLGIAEGIETALSVTELFQVPCWAALNSGQLEKWLPPENVTHVTIYGDNDRFGSWAGEAAAYLLAKKLSTMDLSVDVLIPDVDGWDWNDVLKDRRRG